MENFANQNNRPTVTPESENFDAKGNLRSNREMADGTVAFLSDEEYKTEIENQRN